MVAGAMAAAMIIGFMIYAIYASYAAKNKPWPHTNEIESAWYRSEVLKSTQNTWRSSDMYNNYVNPWYEQNFHSHYALPMAYYAGQPLVKTGASSSYQIPVYVSMPPTYI